MAYFVLSAFTFLLLLLGYIMYKASCPEDYVVIPTLIGGLSVIYWILITSAIVIYSVKKYIEIGDMQIFLMKLCHQGG